MLNAEIDRLRTALKASESLKRGYFDEIERLKTWIADLQSGGYINCVYCGHRYGPHETTPVSMADALKEHIAQCPEHPMADLLKVVRLYLSTYAQTQTHPTVSQEAAVMNAASAAVARAVRRPPPDEPRPPAAS